MPALIIILILLSGCTTVHDYTLVFVTVDNMNLTIKLSNSQSALRSPHQ